MREATCDYDFVITSGGASNGDFDFIKPVVEDLGELLMTTVNMRPGKAQTFGIVQGTPVFGLPGNPAAAYVGFEMIIRPALRKMQGYTHFERPRVVAKLSRDVKKNDPRRIFLRSTLYKNDEGDYVVAPAKNQSSGLFGVIQRSNCMAIMPEGLESRSAGSLIECVLLDVAEESAYRFRRPDGRRNDSTLRALLTARLALRVLVACRSTLPRALTPIALARSALADSLAPTCAPKHQPVRQSTTCKFARINLQGGKSMSEQNLRFAIVTCSDTRSMKEDTAGAALAALVAENGWECASHVVVKDERADIAAAIVQACDEVGADIVLTCGGSGLSLRDVTPEATRDVCERDVPGIAEAMRYHSLQITPFAMLSRALCMQRGRTIVINLPGSEKAARENWDGIVAALPHAAKMMAGGGH